jgi:hypothetical protein
MLSRLRRRQRRRLRDESPRGRPPPPIVSRGISQPRCMGRIRRRSGRTRAYVPTELSDRLADEVVCQFPLNPLTARGLQHGVVCDGADNTIKKRGSYGSAAYAGAELHETVIERLPL